MMYAWSPNWKANTVGNDHYNLYARRSFDGGEIWTTLPASYTHVDGTTWSGSGTETCENYGAGSEYTTVCTTYGAGEFEQARNLSQLTGNKVTVLDPRYSPTGGIKMLPITDKFDVGGGTLPYLDDAVRDPSKYFMVYETGDNTTVAEGEAVPLDLFYSRATNWGDDYELVEYTTGTDEVIEGFDWLEHDREDLSGEAGNTCNPGGTYYYVIWNQWNEDEHENVSNSDAIFRRIMYLDDGDGTPTSTILYASHTAVSQTAGDILTLVGTAKDNDSVGDGIVAYKWTSDLDGEVSYEKSFSIPGTALRTGWHTFTFRARDNEGNWSPGRSVNVLVGETIYRINLPMVMSNQ
jgi:hypothetical protein